jgi:hypothetical protein
LFLYNYDEKRGYYIDPAGDVSFTSVKRTYRDVVLGYPSKRETDVGNFLKIIVYKLNHIMQKIMKDDSIYTEIPEHICPQTITKDKNCVFWTLYLTQEYVNQFTQLGYIDIEPVLDNLFEMHPTKEDLTILIKEYKDSLYDYYNNND